MDKLLTQAIESIKEGNEGNGRRILAQILRADPRNATAWLWMSSVATTQEQRIECLERVLEIDPSCTEARTGLKSLERQVRRETTVNTAAASQSLPHQLGLPSFSGSVIGFEGNLCEKKGVWLNTDNLTPKVVALRKADLIVGIADSETSEQIQGYLVNGEDASEFTMALAFERRIPYKSIVNVLANAKSDILTIGYTENKKPRSKSISFWEHEVRDEVFENLAKRLERDFVRVTKKFTILRAILIPVFFLAGALIVTYVAYLSAAEIANGEVAPSGSLLATTLGWILSLFGTNGVLISGGFAATVIVVYLVKNMLDPPVYSVLERKKQ